jgi:hypothetical protein
VGEMKKVGAGSVWLLARGGERRTVAHGAAVPARAAPARAKPRKKKAQVGRCWDERLL